MIRGRVDVLIPHADSLTIIDYKTDHIPPTLVPARAETYQPQISLYRQAFDRITGKPLTATYLVFLTPRLIHRL
jgi:ATP-dependent helicase/nuclease subunit A